MRSYLAFDEGTTSARTAVYDETLKRVSMAARPTYSRHPHPGWVEQSALDIWGAQLESAREAIAQARISPDTIAAMGITNQRETVVVWDRNTGTPIAPAIVWQCRRTADYCKELAQSPAADMIFRKTGLVVDAYFSGSKVRWLLENVADARSKARNGDLLLGTIDTWLIWNLTNGRVHVTDVTNASRTMLFDIHTGTWDRELLALFDIPESMLPRVTASAEVVGVTAAEHLGAEVPIAGNAGDQQAALFGQCCFQPGMSKNTYGTGCFALMHTGDSAQASQNRLLTTRAASRNGAQYAIEGSIFVAGAVVQWLRDQLRLFASASETEAIARSVNSTDGVYFVPAFVGLGAPYWAPDARASISGVSLGTGVPHLVRAALESIAYQTRDLIEAMQADSGKSLVELRVDGGATQNDFLMQFQADILGCRLVRPADTETTARGAASLAALASGGDFTEATLAEQWRADRIFEPQMSKDQRDELYAGWKRAVARTLA